MEARHGAHHRAGLTAAIQLRKARCPDRAAVPRAARPRHRGYFRRDFGAALRRSPRSSSCVPARPGALQRTRVHDQGEKTRPQELDRACATIPPIRA
jgi:hypothetical protein